MSGVATIEVDPLKEALATVEAWARDGWVVVPSRPTQAMVEAAIATGVTEAAARHVFAAMIAAADEGP